MDQEIAQRRELQARVEAETTTVTKVRDDYPRGLVMHLKVA